MVSASESGSFQTVAYTNTRNTAPLTIRKVPGGNAFEKDREFTFTVTLTGREGIKLDGTYACAGKYTSLKFELDADGNAVATFTLKGNESLTITEILADTEYTVTETDPTQYGYFTTIDDEETHTATGTISDAEDAVNEVAVTNTRNTGSITLNKVVEGSGKDAIKSFQYTVKLWRDDDIPLTGNNKPEGAEFTYAKPDTDIAEAAYGVYTATVTVEVGTALNIS